MKGPWHCAGLIALALLLPAPAPVAASPVGEWVLLNEPRSRVGAIETAPAEPGRLLVSLTEAGGAPPVNTGVWLSEDAGATWGPARVAGFGPAAGAAITMTPDGMAYILSSSTLHFRAPGEVDWDYRTLAYLGTLTPPGFLAHGVQPDAPVWAAVNGPTLELRRVFRFDPASRTSLPVRLPDVATARHVHALAVDRGNPERIVLATSWQPQPSQDYPLRLWISDDWGDSWSAPSIAGLPAVGISRIDLDGQRMHAAFAGEQGGLFVHEAGAGAWTPVLPDTLASVDVHDFSLEPASGEVVAVATAQGVLVPGEAGGWVTLGGEGAEEIAWSVRVDHGGNLYAGIGDNGLFRKTPAGTGLAAVGGALNPPPSTGIAARRGAPEHMVLAESGQWAPTLARLMGSSDGGASWTLQSGALDYNRIHRTLIGHDGALWAQGSAPADGGSQSLHRRDEAGAWHDRTPSVGSTRARSLGPMLQPEGMPSRLLATSRDDRTDGTTAYRLRVWTSDDDGASWSSPLSLPELYFAGLLDALDTGWAPELLMAGLDSQRIRLFHSGDGGDEWSERLHTGLLDPFGSHVYGCVGGARTAGARAYLLGVSVYTSRLHVSSSSDGGMSWQRSDWGSSHEQVGLPSAMACDPDDADRVWVGTRFGRVFASTDGGATFASLEGGYPAPGHVEQMLPTEGGLYLATHLGAFAWLQAATPALSVSNIGSRMRPRLQVAWWEGQAQTELLRDGVLVATGAAAGVHEASVQPWELPVRFQACVADRSICSDEVEFRR